MSSRSNTAGVRSLGSGSAVESANISISEPMSSTMIVSMTFETVDARQTEDAVADVDETLGGGDERRDFDLARASS